MSDCFWLLLISEFVVVIILLITITAVAYLHGSIVAKIELIDDTLRTIAAKE